MLGGACAEHPRPRVYIASPIFTPEQLATVGDVVDVCHEQGYVTYSPARDGVMLKPTDPPSRRDEVFFSNVLAIRQSDLLIAILDVKDTGTTWEIGVATGLDCPIVAVTVAVDRMNVMLERGVTAHVRNLHDLSSVLGSLVPFLSYGTKHTTEVREGFMRTLELFKALYSYSGETQ